MFKQFFKNQDAFFYIYPVVWVGLAIDAFYHRRIMEGILWVGYVGMYAILSFQDFLLTQYRDVVTNVIALIPEIEDLQTKKDLLKAISRGWAGDTDEVS